LCALLPLFVLATHLASSLHFALISHEICDVHGELEHGAASHADHERPAQQPAPLAAFQPAGEEDAHEHCLLAGKPREELALRPSPLACVAPAPLVTATPARVEAPPAPARAEVLLFAPKQSPPSV
jgi:hypothetical protein